MDLQQTHRLRHTLDSLIHVRENMQHILQELTTTESEMLHKLAQAKRNDDHSAPDRKLLLHLQKQSHNMSGSVLQLRQDNQELASAVEKELHGLLDESSKHLARVSEVARDAGLCVADGRLDVAPDAQPEAQVQAADPEEDRDVAEDPSDAHDLSQSANSYD